MVRRTRRSIYGILFFRDLAIVVAIPVVVLVAVGVLAKAGLIALLCAVVVAIGLVVSPVGRRLRRGLIAPFKKRDIWSGYYKD